MVVCTGLVKMFAARFTQFDFKPFFVSKPFVLFWANFRG